MLVYLAACKSTDRRLEFNFTLDTSSLNKFDFHIRVQRTTMVQVDLISHISHFSIIFRIYGWCTPLNKPGHTDVTQDGALLYNLQQVIQPVKSLMVFMKSTAIKTTVSTSVLYSDN